MFFLEAKEPRFIRIDAHHAPAISCQPGGGRLPDAASRPGNQTHPHQNPLWQYGPIQLEAAQETKVFCFFFSKKFNTVHWPTLLDETCWHWLRMS
jgi:hypothetical protein